MNPTQLPRDPRGQDQECCGNDLQCCNQNEEHLPLPEKRPPTDLGPGNEGKEWARRDSETEMTKQGNRQPERRGAQSPGTHTSTANEDDLPEWLRVKEGEFTESRLAPTNHR